VHYVIFFSHFLNEKIFSLATFYIFGFVVINNSASKVHYNWCKIAHNV